MVVAAGITLLQPRQYMAKASLVVVQPAYETDLKPKTLPLEHGKASLEELFIAVAREPLDEARVGTS